MLESIFLNIVASVLFERGRQGLGKFFTEAPSSKAISTTATEFPNIPIVEDALTKWCKSDDFAAQFDVLQSGQDQYPDNRLINSFIDFGGFSDGINNTHSSALRVLEAFFKHLEIELYKTEFGPVIEAQRAKLRHHATQAGIQNISQQVQHQPIIIEEIIKKVLDSRSLSFDPETSPLVQEKIHFAKIEMAIELLKEGKAKSARTRLETLRASLVDETPSVNLCFRLAANLASCALELGDFKTARREYEAAIDLKPDHRLVLSYAAQAAMLDEDSEAALTLAQRSRPADERDPQITSTYIRVLHHVNRDSEIEDLLRAEEWIEQDPNCAFALGLIRLGGQNHAQVEAYFRTALRGDEGNPHAHRLLAQAIILPIDEVIHNNPPSRLSKETLARVGEAENHLTRAVEGFETYENPGRLYEALLQRAYVRGLVGQTFLALADCDRLLTANPKDAESLKQKAHTLLFAGRIDDALQCFAIIEDENVRREATLSIALAYHRLQQHSRVIDLLADKWQPSDPLRRQLLLADLLLSAYHHTGNTERIAAIVDDLERERANDPEALVIIARQFMRTGQKPKALEHYTKALAQASPGNQHDRISLELADFYFEAEDWSKAVPLYKDAIDQSGDNPLVRNYLTSLHNSGARRDALILAQKLRDGGEAIPFVSEVEVRVLAAIDENEAALQLILELAQREPQKVSHRLWITHLQRQLKKYDESRATLAGISYEEVRNDVSALIQIAKFRQQLDLGGDLPFAYRARRIGFNDEEVHHAYVQLFMDHTHRESGDLDVKGVAVDFAVHLKDSKGEKKTYVIVEQQEYDLQHNEIPPHDPRAVKLLGSHTGDRVTFNEGRVDEIEYEIVDVQSKYVYAYQQTIIRHTEWFGGSDAMFVMNVADGDFSKLFRMLDRQEQRQQETAKMYLDRRLPLATLAQLKGKNLFETWASLVHSKDARLYVTTGEPSEVQRGTEILAASDAAVLELSALFTLRHLDLLDKIPLTFRRIVVAKVVFDKLNKWVAELESQTPYMTVRANQGQYFWQDITEEMITRRQNFLGEIKSFIEQHAEVLPAIKILDVPSEQLEQYEEVLGASAASLFVASHTKLPLYADDLGLNQFAAIPEWQVQGVSTPAVLARMKSRGLLSAIKHCDALKTLILANYHIISVNSQQLFWMCRSEGMKATPSMKRILKLMLQGPEWEDESILRVAADFTYRMWLESLEQDDKLRLVGCVVGALVSGRNDAKIRTRFKEVLEERFVYLLRALPLIYERVDSYKQPSDDREQETAAEVSETVA